MKNLPKYYEVSPKVIPADTVSEIRIRPLFSHVAFPDIDKIKVTVKSVDGLYSDGHDWIREGNDPLRSIHIENGVLVIEAYFTDEQKYCIEVIQDDIPGNHESSTWMSRGPLKTLFWVYSLRPDLMKLYPYKGDFHIHTNNSDGHEAPEYVAMRYRQEGYDFAAITDHMKRQPSLNAMNTWKDLSNGFKLFPGEEIHPPRNPVHIVNFGGSFSVNKIFQDDETAYLSEVDKYMERLDDDIPQVNRYAVASSEWVFDKIREGGGLALFCHPYWNSGHEYYINERLTTAILRRRNFDAAEILSGMHKYEWATNACQIARYFEERAQGNNFPVVGISDSHGTENDTLFPWYYTIVFAENDSLSELVTAIRAGNCVAVEDMGGDSVPHVYGDFRLVKYAGFLLNEYFPYHAKLCRVEGDLMMEYLSGRAEAFEALKMLGNRIEAMRKALFAEAPNK